MENKYYIPYLLLCFLCTQIAAQQQITVMCYNILNYPTPVSSYDARAVDFATIVHYTNADVIAVNELKSDQGATDLVGDLNTNGVNYYMRAPVYSNYGGASLGNMLFYNGNKLIFDSQVEINTATRALSLYKLYVNDPDLACHQDTTFIYFVAMHLKASSGASNSATRLTQCQDLMTYLDSNLPANANIIALGDFNFYSNDYTNVGTTYYEPAYGELTNTPHVHTFIDVIPTWTRNTASDNHLYTQSIRSNSYPGGHGGVPGGIDDRFDFILMTNNIISGADRVTYQTGTYKAFGNDGYHFNDALIDPSVSVPSGTLNNEVPDNIAQALFDMSDHLPVISDLVANYAPSVMPTALAASNVSDVTADLNWSNISSATSYNIDYRLVGASSWTATTSATNMLMLTGLTACADYEARVQSVCASGNVSAYSNIITFNTGATIPTSLATANISSTTADLSWSNVAGVASYVVEYRLLGAGSWTSSNATTNSLNLSSLSPCSDYEFQVQSVCANGNVSAFSSISTFSTSVTTPTSLATANISSTTADLSWSNVAGTANYVVEYRLLGVGSWTSSNATTNSLNLSSLSPCSDYEFQVQSVCANGNMSAFSSISTFSTSVTTPISLATANITSTTADVSWTNVTGAASYIVEYRLVGAGSWTSLSGSSNSLNLSGLSPCSDYEFQVQSVCANGTVSGFSSISTFSTSVTTPTSLATANISSTTADLSWSNVAGAVSYVVEYRLLGAGSWTSSNATTNSLNLSGLSPCSDYEFQVQSVCANGNVSAFSSISTFSTTNCTLPLQLKVFLEGPYNIGTGLMNTNLQAANLLPLTQPYNIAPWNYAGTESVANATAIPANTVDWILVELRDATNNNILIAQQAAFLLHDGSVVATDGSVLNFPNSLAGNYFVAIRHRNHLAIISAAPVSFPNTSVYDFTNISNVMMGSVQTEFLTFGKVGMYASDVNANGLVSVADFNDYINDLAVTGMYVFGDTNLDGTVSVTDYNLYKKNASVIGLSVVRY